ncbi:MAG TPA: ABC transporter permease [Acidimicrobiales bacterium]|nr:ABC transporter permease [Acidimicrobiales bacterium]
MPERTTNENFVIQTPERVAKVEAGSHTLASVGAGIELSGSDVHGLTAESKSQWRIVLGRFFHQRLAVTGLCVFALLGAASVLVGHFWSYSYTDITNNLNDPPSWTNPFGTNSIGNDMFAQVMAGVEKDIQIALTVAAMATVIGVTIGAIAGFYRGWVDSLLMRFVDLVLVLPVLAVLIVLANKLSKESNNWLGLAIIIGLLSWTYVARLVRADFLSLRERDFVEASRALGATNRRIITRHMLPNAVGPIIVNATLTVALSIIFETTLSYLGLGVQPPGVSLGLLVDQGQDSATTEWWLFVFPVVFLIILILSIFLIGDGLREAFDPKKSHVRA